MNLTKTLPTGGGLFLHQKRAVLFANGEILEPDRLRSVLREDDLLIAVDGGLRHIISMGLWPSALIGDLDSVSKEDIESVREHGSRIMKFPVEKNETDLQLAINFALEQGCKEIIIAAGLGGRLDQTLGNLFLLSRPDLNEMSIRLDDGREEVFLIRTSAGINGYPGDIVSLLPLGEDVFDVKTEALKYPLDYEKLFPYETRGISNVMESTYARVSISRGVLICIHTRK